MGPVNMGRVTRRHAVLRVGPEETIRRIDSLAVEEPLEIRLNGEPYLVTMRTPGNDIDLVHGLLYSEGVISERSDIVLARYCAGSDADGVNSYNVLEITLQSGASAPAAARRNVVTSSACGICGATSIEHVMHESPYAADPEIRVQTGLILSAPTLLRQYQRAFDQTGGLHAAGLLGLDSSMVCVREDVGRHNAVDKVIGWAIREQLLPLRRSDLGGLGTGILRTHSEGRAGRHPGVGGCLRPELAGRRTGRGGGADAGRIRARRNHERLHTSAAHRWLNERRT